MLKCFKRIMFAVAIGATLLGRAHAGEEPKNCLFEIRGLVKIYPLPSNPEILVIDSPLPTMGRDYGKAFDFALFLKRNDGFDVHKMWRITPSFDFCEIYRDLQAFLSWNDPDQHRYTYSYFAFKR